MQTTSTIPQVDQQITREESSQDSTLPSFQKMPQTPITKNISAFKSPAPSHKKRNLVPKSPMVTTSMRMSSYHIQAVTSSTEKWAVSPVCSRLRDHITMLNGNSSKERLFLQSPMTNNYCWPLASPALDPYRTLNLASTAYNTSQSSKYMTYGTHESYSDMKSVQGVGESPMIRRFMDQD